MKIKKQTSQILELGNDKFHSGRLSLFLFATPFLCAGIAVILFIGKLNTLKCERVEIEQISCQLIRQGLKGIETINIRKLYSAELGVSDKDDGETYGIKLNTSEGIIHLTEGYSSGRKNKLKKVEQMNNFIADKTQTYTQIKQDDRLFAYSFGGIFILVGIRLMIGSLRFYRPINCIFDKNKEKFFIREDNLFQSKIKEYNLIDIKSVAMVEEKDSEGDSILKPKIILNNNFKISLDITGEIYEQEMMIKSINNFLDLTDSNKK